MSVIVKHRTDLELVAARVGVELGGAGAPNGAARTLPTR